MTIQNSHKKVSSSIDIVKFLLAAQILICHAGLVFGISLIDSAFIYVEWFYVFIGYTLAYRIINEDNRYNTFLTSCEIIKSRILSILPYYFLSSTIALIMKLWTSEFIIEESWAVHKIIFEYLLLSMTAVPVASLTNVSWFLSAMVFAMILLVPFAVKYKHKFFRWSILIYIVIYYYFFITDGYIYDPSKWTPFGYKGLLRAVGSISLGLFGYEFGLLFKDKFKNYILESIIVIFSYAVIFYIVKYRPDQKLFFLFPFIYMLLIIIQMQSKKFIIPVSPITSVLSKLSITLYLNHLYVFLCINKISKASMFYKLNFAICVSFIISVFVYIVVDLIKYIKSNSDLKEKI